MKAKKPATRNSAMKVRSRRINSKALSPDDVSAGDREGVATVAVMLIGSDIFLN
jgi:hypothetical protein